MLMLKLMFPRRKQTLVFAYKVLTSQHLGSRVFIVCCQVGEPSDGLDIDC